MKVWLQWMSSFRTISPSGWYRRGYAGRRSIRFVPRKYGILMSGMTSPMIFPSQLKEIVSRYMYFEPSIYFLSSLWLNRTHLDAPVPRQVAYTSMFGSKSAHSKSYVVSFFVRRADNPWGACAITNPDTASQCSITTQRHLQTYYYNYRHPLCTIAEPWLLQLQTPSPLYYYQTLTETCSVCTITNPGHLQIYYYETLNGSPSNICTFMGQFSKGAWSLKVLTRLSGRCKSAFTIKNWIPLTEALCHSSRALVAQKKLHPSIYSISYSSTSTLT